MIHTWIRVYNVRSYIYIYIYSYYVWYLYLYVYMYAKLLLSPSLYSSPNNRWKSRRHGETDSLDEALDYLHTKSLCDVTDHPKSSSHPSWIKRVEKRRNYGISCQLLFITWQWPITWQQCTVVSFGFPAGSITEEVKQSVCLSTGSACSLQQEAGWEHLTP